MPTPREQFWSEFQHEVMNLDAAAFISGVDVSNYLTGQISLTANNRGGWNSCSITLSNAEDIWIYSPPQALAVRAALTAGQNGAPPKTGILEDGRTNGPIWRLGNIDYRYSEAPKYQLAQFKSGKLNSYDPDAQTWRWEPHAGATCFNKYDHIRVFVHDPRTSETDTDTPAWLPGFSGFIDNISIHDDPVTGERRVTITANDIRYFLTVMRVDVSMTSGQHMGNALIDIGRGLTGGLSPGEIDFKDARAWSRVGHALEFTKFVDAVQHIICGGTQEVDADGFPVGKLKVGKFTQIGSFKLGQIVEMAMAPEPGQQQLTAIQQLTSNKGGKQIATGKSSVAAQKNAAVALARKKVAQAQEKLTDLRQDEALRDHGSSVRTTTDQLHDNEIQIQIRGAQQQLESATRELAQVSASQDPNASPLPPEELPLPPLIPEFNTDLPTGDVAKLEDWYGMGLFGNWDEQIKEAIQRGIDTSGKGSVVETDEPVKVFKLELKDGKYVQKEDMVAAAPMDASGRVNPANLPASVPPDAQIGPDGFPLRDTVTGEYLRRPGAINSQELAGNAGSQRGNPATTTTTTSQATTPQRQQLMPSNSSGQVAGPTSASRDSQQSGDDPVKKITLDPITITAGPDKIDNGAANGRLLTWKEVSVIGAGTHWDGAFDVTARNLYILVPAKDTGPRNFADQTSPQTIGFHDRYFISRKEVIDGFLEGIDYQWWVSGAGDLFVEPNMCDFQPADFGEFGDCMVVDRHLEECALGDEHGKIPSVVTAVGAANNPLAGGIATAGTVRQQAIDRLFIRRYGITVHTTSYPFVADPKVLKALAVVDLQKAVAHCNNAEPTFSYRPYLLPNKPLYLRHRFRMGTSTAVNQVLQVFGKGTTRAALDYVRMQRYDGRFILLTGSYDAPQSARRLLPADYLNGPSRTGVRTNSDLAKDPSMGGGEVATAKDLKNKQIEDIKDNVVDKSNGGFGDARV